MSLIGIQLDGDTDFLDVQEDTTIEITLKNPLLASADSLSPGGYSIPFNLPAGEDSPKNRGKLKFPDVLESNRAFQIQKANLFFDANLFKKGTLKASSSGKQVTSNFFFGLNSLNPSLKTARLRDVMNENVVIDASAITKKIYFKHTAAGDWTVTVNGKSYTGVDANDIKAQINLDAEATEDKGLYVPWAEVGAIASPGGMAAPWVSVIARKLYTFHDPDLMLTFHLHQDSTDPLVELAAKVDDAETANYSFESFDMTAYYTAFETFLANYISGAFPSDKYRFPVFFNANLYEADKSTIKATEIINAVGVAGLKLNDWVHFKNYNSIQPFVLLKYVLDKIAAIFDFQFEGDFYTHPEVPKILLDNSNTLDVPLDYIGSNKYVFWQRSFNVNDLVPDWSVIEFLKSLASRYNLGFYFNEATQKVRIKFLENIARSNIYTDITTSATPVDNNEDQRVTGYNLLCKKDETDKLSINESVTIGIAQDTVEITCGRLFQTNFAIIDGGTVQGPRVSRKNNDPKFPLRVFHFKGMVANGTFSYQAADISGDDFYEGLSDNILSEGIYSRYFKYWLEFKKNWRLVTINVNWPFRRLLKYDWEKKLRFDRSNYIVSQMKVKLTNKGVAPTEIQLYTMK